MGTDLLANPLVSVVLPVYNVAHFLGESIRSILAQTYQNFEIIAVDDGSTDTSGQMLDDWAKREDRIHVIHQKNQGLSAARNTGLAQVKGDFVYFLDSDDCVAPNLFQRCFEVMRHYSADFVTFKFDTISSEGKLVKSDYFHNEYTDTEVMTPKEAIKAQLRGDIAAYAWSFIAKASVYKENNITFPVGRKIEDLARICIMIGESTRIVRIPEVLYHYRLRSGSLMGHVSPSLLHDWSKAVDDREEYISRRYPELKSYMLLQSLNFFSTVDLAPLRQTLKYGLKLDWPAMSGEKKGKKPKKPKSKAKSSHSTSKSRVKGTQKLKPLSKRQSTKSNKRRSSE
jgi:glycosyltransferase involved in cell wall biosynthesis